MVNKIKKQRPQRTSRRRRDHSTVVPLRVPIAELARIIHRDAKEGDRNGRV